MTIKFSLVWLHSVSIKFSETFQPIGTLLDVEKEIQFSRKQKSQKNVRMRNKGNVKPEEKKLIGKKRKEKKEKKKIAPPKQNKTKRKNNNKKKKDIQ